jgi:hypothetical protein
MSIDSPVAAVAAAAAKGAGRIGHPRGGGRRGGAACWSRVRKAEGGCGGHGRSAEIYRI